MSPDKFVPVLLLAAILIWLPWYVLTALRGPGGLSRARVGSLLILFGVSAWVPYLLLKIFQDYSGSAMPFLAVHLSGVIPGAILVGRGWTRRLVEMFQQREEQP